MKHLTEHDFLALQSNEVISPEKQKHLQTCLYCKSELSQIEAFDSMIIDGMAKSQNQEIDIRKNVFNELNIEFNVEKEKDYFHEIALIGFIIVLITTFILFPVNIEMPDLFSWLPTEQIKPFFSKYKMAISGIVMFSLLYALDRLKQNFRENIGFHQ